MIEQTVESEKDVYLNSRAKKFSVLALLAVALVIVTVLACTIGTGYDFAYVFKVIWDHITGTSYVPASSEWWADYYIWNNVMPEILMALIAGAGLSIAGAVMQSIMENPLADAYTTGISSGACLGAVSAMIMGFGFATAASGMGVILNAFVGALIPAVVIILLTRYIGNSPATMILVGSALSFFFNALMTLLMVTASAETLQDAYLWQIGSVTKADWEDIPLMIVSVAVSSVLVQIVASKLNVLSLGENTAKSLGVDVSQFRMLCLILISVLVASIISFTGIIGFIGLVAPHIARTLMGSDNRFVIPGSIILGSLILVAADLVSRLLYSYGTVPIGVVMSFVGAPVFLYLIISKKTRRSIY